jgi:hypothetical protein
MSSALRARARPLREGLPISARRTPSGDYVVGTVGGLVRNERQWIMIGSAHVFPDGTNAIWQPMPCGDGDCACNRVGATVRSVKGVVTFEGHRYYVDCGSGACDDGAVDDGTPQALRVTDARVGLQVTKDGAGSGRTIGLVAHVKWQPFVRDLGVRAPNQILIRPMGAAGSYPRFSVDGDSGALVRDDSGRAVGLIWGSTNNGEAIASPIRPVLHALQLLGDMP